MERFALIPQVVVRDEKGSVVYKKIVHAGGFLTRDTSEKVAEIVLRKYGRATGTDVSQYDAGVEYLSVQTLEGLLAEDERR